MASWMFQLWGFCKGLPHCALPKFVHTHAHTHAHTRAHALTHTCTHTHTHTHLHMYTHTHVHTHTHTYTHLHTLIYAHTLAHAHTHTCTHTPPPLNSLSMAERWARSWYTNVFCQSAGWLTRLLNDGSPLRPVLHMLAPLRKVGLVFVNEVYPALRGSSRFPLPSMWSASQNLPLWPVFWHSPEVTKPLQPLVVQLFFYR